jgi:Cu/Ag efflux protein CusF
MRRIRRLFSALVLAGASCSIATPAFADQPSSQDAPAPIAQKTKKITATATVVKVDAQRRDLTLRSNDGTEFTVEVPQSVRLDRMHEGDRVKVNYYEALALSLKKREAGAPQRADETTVTQHNDGALPGGMVAHRITATVEVVRVDRARNRLTVRRTDGVIDTFNVTDPALQAQLASVHEGDRIQATYTEAAAITVMREGQASPQNPPSEQNEQPPPSQQPPPSSQNQPNPQSEPDQHDQHDQQDLANPPK